LEARWWVWKQMEKLMRDSILSVASTRFCRSASAKKIHYKNVKNDRELRGSPCSLNLCSAARIWSLTHVLCWSPFTCRCLTWIRLCWVYQNPRCPKVDGREKGSFSNTNNDFVWVTKSMLAFGIHTMEQYHLEYQYSCPLLATSSSLLLSGLRQSSASSFNQCSLTFHFKISWKKYHFEPHFSKLDLASNFLILDFGFGVQIEFRICNEKLYKFFLRKILIGRVFSSPLIKIPYYCYFFGSAACLIFWPFLNVY